MAKLRERTQQVTDDLVAGHRLRGRHRRLEGPRGHRRAGTDEAGQARRDPAHRAAVIEETLRLHSPLQNATWRFPTEDVEIGGRLMRPGDPILTWWPSPITRGLFHLPIEL
jgi:cytochrome P450